MNALIAPSIFKYLDYRHFLSETYHFLKKTQPQFSFRSFAKDSGMNSPSFLKLVIDNKRNLTDDSIEKFAHALKLKSEESEFFRTLVKYNQAGSAEEKIRNYKWLQKLLAEQYVDEIAKSPEHEFWSEWMSIAKKKLNNEGHTAATISLFTEKLSEIEGIISQKQSYVSKEKEVTVQQ